MKIVLALFRYFPFGGMQRDFLAIAAELARRGHRLVLYCHSWEAPPQPEWLTVDQLTVRGCSNHARAADFARRFLAALPQEQADLVIAFNRVPGSDVYFAADNCFAAAARKKCGGLLRFLPRYRIFTALERAIFDPKAKTEILYLTPHQLPDFQRIYHTPAERFHLLPPGIAADRRPPADPAAARARIRAELHLAPEALLLLQIASAAKTKGVDRSCLALAALPETLREHTVYAVAGADVKNSRNAAERAGVSDQIRILGGRNDVPELIAAADLMIHPARNESAGNVLLEALVGGLPVLTTGCCGYAGIVQKAGGLVLPEPFAQTDLNQALKELLRHPERREAMRNAAQAYCQRHDFTRRAESAADLIEKLAAEKKARP